MINICLIKKEMNGLKKRIMLTKKKEMNGLKKTIYLMLIRNYTECFLKFYFQILKTKYNKMCLYTIKNKKEN